VWGQLKSRRRRGPRLRVGWAGAQQHAGDLRLLRDVVAATHGEVDWVFFGMLPEETRPLIAEVHDYVPLAAYPEKLASLDLDLAFAPLEIHPFNEAKSNLRLLEYGVLGWPVICTDIFPYRTDDPPVVRLPNDAEKWIAAIRERIADPDALAREGDALRAWVEKHYLLENRLGQWFEAFTR
jgi:glycosyltransferase involved in cell wall biosynthesis